MQGNGVCPTPWRILVLSIGDFGQWSDSNKNEAAHQVLIVMGNRPQSGKRDQSMSDVSAFANVVYWENDPKLAETICFFLWEIHGSGRSSSMAKWTLDKLTVVEMPNQYDACQKVLQLSIRRSKTFQEFKTVSMIVHRTHLSRCTILRKHGRSVTSQVLKRH